MSGSARLKHAYLVSLESKDARFAATADAQPAAKAPQAFWQFARKQPSTARKQRPASWATAA